MQSQPRNMLFQSDRHENMTPAERKAFNKTAFRVRITYLIAWIIFTACIGAFLLYNDPHFELFDSRVKPGRPKVPTDVICEVLDCAYG